MLPTIFLLVCSLLVSCPLCLLVKKFANAWEYNAINMQNNRDHLNWISFHYWQEHSLIDQNNSWDFGSTEHSVLYPLENFSERHILRHSKNLEIYSSEAVDRPCFLYSNAWFFKKWMYRQFLGLKLTIKYFWLTVLLLPLLVQNVILFKNCHILTKFIKYQFYCIQFFL